jgi:hypothetical protein
MTERDGGKTTRGARVVTHQAAKQAKSVRPEFRVSIEHKIQRFINARIVHLPDYSAY